MSGRSVISLKPLWVASHDAGLWFRRAVVIDRKFNSMESSICFLTRVIAIWFLIFHLLFCYSWFGQRFSAFFHIQSCWRHKKFLLRWKRSICEIFCDQVRILRVEIYQFKLTSSFISVEVSIWYINEVSKGLDFVRSCFQGIIVQMLDNFRTQHPFWSQRLMSSKRLKIKQTTFWNENSEN